MENLTFSAPGLLFPAISLLMLAYTNRFLGLAGVARALITKYRERSDPATAAQIASLRRRLLLTRHMQALGVMSLTSCVACLWVLFLNQQTAARWMFAAALLLMLGSLLVSLRENFLSVHALEIEMVSALSGSASQSG